MLIEPTPIPGVLLIKPRVFADERGSFVETWQRERYAAAGIGPDFAQDNHSRSGYGTLRGLHFQRRWPQGKLVMVSDGEVFDVAVDLRPGSPTFGRWFGAVLSGDNQHQLWLPRGMAHGFLVLSEKADFHYKCDDLYHPGDEGAVRWDDPDLAIAWPRTTRLRLSPKDAAAPFLRELSLAPPGPGAQAP